MRRIKKMMAIMGMMTLILTGCSQSESKGKMDNKNTMSMEQTGDTMSKDNIKKDSMEGDTIKEDMKKHSMESDAMKDSSMKDGSMSSSSINDKKMEKIEIINDGDIAPDFSLKDSEGDTYTLSGQGGKKVYIKFWASWCSTCLSGLEELNTLAGGDNNFEIVTVVAPGKNGEKSKEEFVKWFKTLGYSNIKVLFDETGEVINAYRVRVYPTSAFVGTDGVLVSLAPGHLSSEYIREGFEQVK